MPGGRKIVAYYRVSTREQGDSGLGLEAQAAAVEAYALGTEGTILRAYREVETGKRADRPELTRAIAHANRSKAILMIAKLDRLSRNVEFMAKLMNSGVDFLACDNPHANRLTIHILAAVAENEAKMISDRTTAALLAYKVGRRVSKAVRAMYPDGVPAAVAEATGGKLGSHNPRCRRLSPEHSARGRAAARVATMARTREEYADLAPIVLELHQAGRSLRQIAAVLDAEGHTTRRGRPWNPVQVARVLRRAQGPGDSGQTSAR